MGAQTGIKYETLTRVKRKSFWRDIKNVLICNFSESVWVFLKCAFIYWIFPPDVAATYLGENSIENIFKVLFVVQVYKCWDYHINHITDSFPLYLAFLKHK